MIVLLFLSVKVAVTTQQSDPSSQFVSLKPQSFLKLTAEFPLVQGKFQKAER